MGEHLHVQALSHLSNPTRLASACPVVEILSE
ncbi:rCG21483 [Rattus norvegicus]|uniref:RCG21483 n=1 Tax=Rattus norvegicus TaxID=10116 RepID=A6J0T9_RAT|nr:rCG21483 [Rattus norvegicus]